VSVLTLVGDGGSSSGTFDGEITVDENITTDDYITFYYYGENVDVQKTGTTTIDFSTQNGLLKSNAKEDDVTPIKGKLIAFGKAEYNEAGKYEAELLVPFAIAKLAFKSFTGDDITVTCDKSMPVGYTISKDGEISYKYGAAKASSEMTFNEYDSSNPYYAVFVPTYDGSNPVEKTYTLRQGEKVEFLKAAFSGAYFTAGDSGQAASVEPPFCFTAKQAGSTVAMAKVGTAPDVNLEYSINGTAWTPFTVGETTVTLPNIDDKVYFRANGTNTKLGNNYVNCNKFVTTGNLKVSGNIMYLLDGATPAVTLNSSSAFNSLFRGCNRITDFSELLLPATTLSNFCYMYMFGGCTALTKAPELPATTMWSGCYKNMFDGCTALETAPALPATTLSSQCYQNMFKGCSKLSSVTMLATENITSTGISGTLNDWLSGAGSDASVTSAKLYVDKTMTNNTTITGTLPSSKWSVAAGN